MDERGFTLIELLVVILIIGILVVIALPSFLSQVGRANDADAKSDVRNAVSQMESCRTDETLYSACPNLETPLASGVTPAILDGGARYSVAAVSATGTKFTIEREDDGYTRSCTVPATGGCRADSTW